MPTNTVEKPLVPRPVDVPEITKQVANNVVNMLNSLLERFAGGKDMNGTGVTFYVTEKFLDFYRECVHVLTEQNTQEYSLFRSAPLEIGKPPRNLNMQQEHDSYTDTTVYAVQDRQPAFRPRTIEDED